MFLPMLILASVIGAMAANDVTYYDGSALTGACTYNNLAYTV